MKYDMQVYYTVLHFLRDFFVDREYPISFHRFNGSYNCDSVEESTEYISAHKKSYKLSGVSEGDKVTFITTHNRKYDTCDKLGINVASPIEFNSSDIDILFSEAYVGEPVKKEISNTQSISYGANEIHTIDYSLKDTATTLDKKTKYLNNLLSITLRFNKDFEVVYVSDMVFRTIEYQKTLEELDYHIEDAKNHIRGRIGRKKIPEELSHLIPKAAAAYTFIEWWEAEGRVMSDGTNRARNYYDRLMSDIDGVNDVIDRWLAKQEEPGINTELVGSVRVNRYGRNKCFSRNTRRFGKRIDKSRYL